MVAKVPAAGVDLTTESSITLKNPATADNSTFTLNLQTGETDIAADDVIGKIEFQAPDEGTGTDAITVAAAIQARSEGDFSSSANATSLDFMTGASEAAAKQWSLLSTGHWLPAATDHGIYLGVNSATASNLLDDYEEGTWTPVVKSNANTITGGTRLATYTKVGRMVHVFFSIAGGTTSGTIDNSGDFFRIQGLPFTAANVAGTRYIGTQYNHYTNPATTEENVVGLVGQNESVIEFVEHDGGGTGYSGARLEGVGSNSYAQFAVVYYVE